MSQYQRIGSYRIVRLLGMGGMGAVYEAVSERIGRRVAIKVLHADVASDRMARTRFLNEARIVNRVRHPSLVTVHELGDLPDGSSYIVMEYLEGETLASRLGRRGDDPLPLNETLRLVRQVASALAAVHAQGIVHRDLKPDNLMLVDDPEVPGGERVKILDFGIAKVYEPSAGERSGTATGIGLGTPLYIPPEQIYGANKVDDRADIYSLGIILFELLRGQPPFIGEQREILGGHLFRPPPELGKLVPGLPTTLVTLVGRMLAKEPQQRPSAVEFMQLLRGMPPTPGGELPAIALPRPTRRRLFASTLTGAALTLLAAIVVMSLLRMPAKQLHVAATAGYPGSKKVAAAAAQSAALAAAPSTMPIPAPPATAPVAAPAQPAARPSYPSIRRVPAGAVPRSKSQPPTKKGLRNADIPMLD